MRKAFMVATAAVLSACGGGGSGGGSAIESISPASLETYAWEGSGGPGLALHVTYKSARPYNAEESHASLDSGFGLFSPVGTAMPGDDPDRELLVTFDGTSQSLEAKDYTGVLEVSICRGGCETVSVPYTIHVLAGVALSQEALNVSVPFGTWVGTKRVDLIYPPDFHIVDVSEWNRTSGGAYASFVYPDYPGIDVRFSMMRPQEVHGYFAFSIRGYTPLASGGYFDRQLNISYEVLPSPGVICAIEPGAAAYHLAAGSTTWAQSHVGMELQEGTSHWITPVIEYLSAPPEATGNSLANGWIYGSWNVYSSDNEYSVLACLNSTCLPAGTYSAVIHYGCVDQSGAQMFLDHPVTMVVDP